MGIIKNSSVSMIVATGGRIPLEKAYREEDNSMEITHIGAPGHQVTLTKILGEMLSTAHDELGWITGKIRVIERDVLGLKQ